jgi:FKBP-type peptidyl-prolyl cis-trans isomerase SlpA
METSLSVRPLPRLPPSDPPLEGPLKPDTLAVDAFPPGGEAVLALASARDAPRVSPGAFLTLHYRLSGPDGLAVVDTFGGKPATLSLGSGQLAPAIEARLIGLTEGARVSFDLRAGEAFGERNAQLLQRVGRALLAELGDPEAEYGVGDVVQFPTPDGQGAYAGVVREVGEGWLLFDFNHPLAGQPVRFEVHLLGVL